MVGHIENAICAVYLMSFGQGDMVCQHSAFAIANDIQFKCSCLPGVSTKRVSLPSDWREGKKFSLEAFACQSRTICKGNENSNINTLKFC